MGNRQGPVVLSLSWHTGAALPLSRRFATNGGQMPDRQAVFPAGRHALYAQHGYSAAIRSGDLLFVSGQVGTRTDGSRVEDLEGEITQAFENLRAVLAAAGCTLDDIVDVTTFHVDPEAQFETVMAVKPKYFPGPEYPNWTAVGVTWLAGFRFEIKAIARIPEQVNHD